MLAFAILLFLLKSPGETTEIKGVRIEAYIHSHLKGRGLPK